MYLALRRAVHALLVTFSHRFARVQVTFSHQGPAPLRLRSLPRPAGRPEGLSSLTNAAALGIASAGVAHSQVWRCNNGYTNSAEEARAKNCRVVDGGPSTGESPRRPSPPSSRIDRDDIRHTLRLKRSPDGHFYVNGTVNGVAVRFVIDTGATSVALSKEAAAAAGLTAERQIRISTAAGERIAFASQALVAVSTLEPTRVQVSFGLPLDVGLLRQSYLRNFNMVVAGDTLVLTRR